MLAIPWREGSGHPPNRALSVFSSESMHVMTPFEDALAEALDRCGHGEPVELVAAEFPEHDLLPYLHLVERIQSVPDACSQPSSDWVERSLQRLLTRKRYAQTLSRDS